MGSEILGGFGEDGKVEERGANPIEETLGEEEMPNLGSLTLVYPTFEINREQN